MTCANPLISLARNLGGVLVVVVSSIACATFAQAETVSTAMGGGADLEVNENFDEEAGAVQDSGDGDDDTANARFSEEFRNEFIVLRFDLSGVDKSLVANTAVNMIAYRTSSNNGKDQRIWGVNSGVADLNTFDESTTVFSTTPGLTWDENPTTQGVVDDDTTFLGHFQFTDPADAEPFPWPEEGETFVINNDLLSISDDPDGLTPEATIDEYIRSLGDDDQAVFLIGGAGESTGQFRITTKEATATDNDVLTGEAGDLAPWVSYSVIPEPASLALLGLGGIGLLPLRRRYA